jgi:hypothetical protein
MLIILYLLITYCFDRFLVNLLATVCIHILKLAFKELTSRFRSSCFSTSILSCRSLQMSLQRSLRLSVYFIFVFSCCLHFFQQIVAGRVVRRLNNFTSTGPELYPCVSIGNVLCRTNLAPELVQPLPSALVCLASKARGLQPSLKTGFMFTYDTIIRHGTLIKIC